MAKPEGASHRRDLVRAALLSGALVTFLLGAAAAGAYNKELRAFYYAARMVRAEKADISYWYWYWHDRLIALGPEAAPACRWVYRRNPDLNVKKGAAWALLNSAGSLEFHEFVAREGSDTPAEHVLLRSLCWGAPREAKVLEYNESLPSVEPRGGLRCTTTALRYTLGDYLVEVTYCWRYPKAGPDPDRLESAHLSWDWEAMRVRVERCTPEQQAALRQKAEIIVKKPPVQLYRSRL